MKKLFFAALLLFALLSFNVLADVPAVSSEQETQQIPTLTSISFKNAKIEGEFSPVVNEYNLILDDPAVTPTLEDFTTDGTANLFVNYELDNAHHQTGICVTLEFDSGSTIYNFKYKNAFVYSVNSNNTLLDLTGNAVEVYPEINSKLSNYRLYIPKDMTVLNLSAVTEDVSAYCNVPEEIEIALDQSPVIPITVTASNGETRLYKFTVKRVDKTTEEVQRLMRSDGFKTLAEDELFYRNPAFWVAALSALAGIFIIMLIVSAAKRISVKAEDEDEKAFFEM